MVDYLFDYITKSSFANVSVILNKLETQLHKGKLTIEKLFKITFFFQNAFGLEYLSSVGWSLYILYSFLQENLWEKKGKK